MVQNKDSPICFFVIVGSIPSVFGPRDADSFQMSRYRLIDRAFSLIDVFAFKFGVEIYMLTFCDVFKYQILSHRFFYSAKHAQLASLALRI